VAVLISRNGLGRASVRPSFCLFF